MVKFLVAAALCASGLLCASLYSQSSQSDSNAGSRELALQVIVVSTPEQASQVLQRLTAGYDFAALAKEKSIDPTAGSGGYMGRMDPNGLRPELRDALKGLGPGQISRITRIPLGYAIIRVIEDSKAAEIEDAPKARLQAMSAYGSIAYSPVVSGFGEAEEAFNRFPKTKGWEQDSVLTCQMRTESLAAATGRLEKLFAPSSRQAIGQQKPLDVMQEHFALGELYSYQGKMDPAIEQYLEAYRIAQEKVPAAVPQMEFDLGIAYLHRSEMLNDAYRAPGEKCLFPMRPGNAFAKSADSQSAIQYLLKYLEQKPQALDARWLLNLSYATLGTYPGGVPAKYLIPLSAFESQESIG